MKTVHIPVGSEIRELVVPDGWSVVVEGPVKSGDRVYDKKCNEFVEDNSCIGLDVDWTHCVIRPNPSAVPLSQIKTEYLTFLQNRSDELQTEQHILYEALKDYMPPPEKGTFTQRAVIAIGRLKAPV